MNPASSRSWVTLLAVACWVFSLVVVLQDAGLPIIGGDPAPFPADKLCVLFVEESGEPGDRGAVLYSTKIRAYITEQGGDFRKLDQHAVFSDSTPQWVKDAMDLPRDELPWLAASNGKSGVSVTLPAQESEVLAILENLE